MIFKGRKFTRNKNIVMLPTRDGDGFIMPYVKSGQENYVCFGRVTKVGASKKGAVKTIYNWKNGEKDGQPVYAVPIESDGYSLTNMMYGNDNKMYLAYDAQCYVAIRQPVQN
jgi:hypothetical protein